MDSNSSQILLCHSFASERSVSLNSYSPQLGIIGMPAPISKSVMSPSYLQNGTLEQRQLLGSFPKNNDNSEFYPDLNLVSRSLNDINFCLTWALHVNLQPKKAETIINTFNIIKTTRDKISCMSHHILKSFFLWFLHKKYPENLGLATAELKIAEDLMAEWQLELQNGSLTTLASDYLINYMDGVEYVVTAMRLLVNPADPNIPTEILYTKPRGETLAGILHIKQEFFRPFIDEIDLRISILEQIRTLNVKDSRACLYLAKTWGQKRKMENFVSAPTTLEMDLLAEGHIKAGGRDHSIVIELCYCLAQYLRNSKETKKFPLLFYGRKMVFSNERAVADFINSQTTQIWNDAPDAAPLYVKLAEVHSSLLPETFRHPDITPLGLVDRALEKYDKYSKALHRKAKVLFKLKDYEEGLKCLEAAFRCGETNCDALCDLIFRLMKYPNTEKLEPIFYRYCGDYGENLWGKRKVGTLYYLCGCHLWMINLKKAAIWHWLQAEIRKPNPTFYFDKLYIQKTDYKWHQANSITYEAIISELKSFKLQKSAREYNQPKKELLEKLYQLRQKYPNHVSPNYYCHV